MAGMQKYLARQTQGTTKMQGIAFAAPRVALYLVVAGLIINTLIK